MTQQIATEENQKRLTTQVPADLADRLEQSARVNGRSVASEMRLALTKWVNEQEKETA